jgi:1,2-diacylglycerol 3-alpha-glucosyltransferase
VSFHPTVAIVFHRFGPYHLARLKASAKQFKVLAIEESTQTAEYAWDEVGIDNSEFQRLTLLQKGDLFVRSPAQEIASRMQASLSEHQPDSIAIPGWSDPAALAALSWGLAKQVPVIMMSESTEFDEPRQHWKEYVKSRVVRLCSAGLAGGTPHKAYLEKLGLAPHKVFTGYDAVDNDHFRAGAQLARENETCERARLALPQRYFLASNRFVVQKNLLLLLESFAMYTRAAGDRAWKLVLLGDGPLRARLVELRQTLGLSEAVLLPGFKQYDELPSYYGLASAFVHASIREPWGLVINEAMASGLPVIVSNRCGCAQDLVKQGKNGFLFDPVNASELADQLAYVANVSPDRLTAMGTASSSLVERWSATCFAENLGYSVKSAQSQAPRRASWADRLLLKMLIWRADDLARQLLPVNS